MQNLFDTLGRSVFRVCQQQFGYLAVWCPQGGGAPVSGRVLFNAPAAKENIGDAEFSPVMGKMEYYLGEFPGLKESVDASTQEVVCIAGAKYIVMAVHPKWDGKTLVATLDEFKPDPYVSL